MDIQAEKQEQKFMFQFVDKESGRRSEPFVSNWDQLAEVLGKREKGESPKNDDYILLVAVLDGEDTRIPATPLITVETFMNFQFEQEGEAAHG